MVQYVVILVCMFSSGCPPMPKATLSLVPKTKFVSTMQCMRYAGAVEGGLRNSGKLPIGWAVMCKTAGIG